MSIYKYFENLIDPLQDHAIERPPASVKEFILFFLSPIRKILFFTLFISGVAVITDLMLYVFVADILDWMAAGRPETFMDEHGSSLLWMALIIGVIRPISVVLSRMMINLTLMPGVVNTIRWRNHRYVLQQSLHFFYGDFAGRITQKVMQTGNALREMLANLIDGLWLLVIYIIGITAFFTQMHVLLLLPIVFWLIGYLAVVIFMVPDVRQHSAKTSEAHSSLTGRLVDSYSNILSVKLFSHSQREEHFAGEGVRSLNNTLLGLMRSIVNMTVALTILNSVLLVGTAALSVLLWSQSVISIGEVTLVNGLIIRLNQMSGWILRTITALFESIGTIENGIETLSQPTLLLDKDNAKKLQVNNAAIEIQQASFAYQEQKIAVIDQIDLYIKPGEKVGLVGRSGAGKSTLTSLLLRLYDLDHGKILIDGQDIASVTQDSLRSQIAMVTQDTALLHRTVKENIRYGKPDATDAEIIQVARLAEAHDFIETLVDAKGNQGYDVEVGERGVKLSGGQRQRIAIARVILKNAPILILDEATSALDSEVETAIQSQLENLMEGKTVLAIAHRLSTIAALDRLIVIDEGRIVEQGTHHELLKQKGIYAKLWAKQSGGFLAQ